VSVNTTSYTVYFHTFVVWDPYYMNITGRKEATATEGFDVHISYL